MGQFNVMLCGKWRDFYSVQIGEQEKMDIGQNHLVPSSAQPNKRRAPVPPPCLWPGALLVLKET